MKLNLGCGPHKLAGFENLDRPEWRWEDGLPFHSGSVWAITVSHSLTYLGIDLWNFAFAEMYRVLAKGGVLRITEDETEDPKSERFGGFHDAITMTSARLVREYLEARFPTVQQFDRNGTLYDGSLNQHWHGDPPKVFFIEGRK